MPDIKYMDDKAWEDIEAITPFRRRENWGIPNKLAKELIRGIVQLRAHANAPVNIHCAYAQAGHSPNSMHYQGLAADLDIKGLSVVEMVGLASEIGFSGIGAYPYWNTPGIHIDCRDIIGKPPVYWLEPKGKEGQYEYCATIEDLIKALSIKL